MGWGWNEPLEVLTIHVVHASTTDLSWQVVIDSFAALENLHQLGFMTISQPVHIHFQDGSVTQWTLEPAARI